MLQKEATCSSDSATSLFAGISCLLAQHLNSWVLDSGASDHMTYDLTLFQSYTDKDHVITLPDGRKVNVQCIGTVCLNYGFELKVVLYVPDFDFNLISWRAGNVILHCD